MPEPTFDERFILREVRQNDIKTYGDDEMSQAIQDHTIISSKGGAAVIVHDDAQGNPF